MSYIIRFNESMGYTDFEEYLRDVKSKFPTFIFKLLYQVEMSDICVYEFWTEYNANLEFTEISKLINYLNNSLSKSSSFFDILNFEIDVNHEYNSKDSKHMELSKSGLKFKLHGKISVR